MRKSEMTAQQLGERAATIQRLVTAGWAEASQGDWFDRDLWADHEATLEYDNGKMVLRIRFSAERRSLAFRIEDYSGGEVALSISYRDKLADVLEAIVRVQDSISPESYRDVIQQLVRDCPEIHVLAGADESTWVRLVDDEHEPSAPQQESKEQFISRLSHAGWSVESDLLERSRGAERNAEAVADFRNGSLELRLSYFRDGWLRLLFVGPEASELPPLRLKWRDGPEALLRTLVEMQDAFSPANYPECTKKLIAVCELVLLETDRGLVRLSL